MATLIRSMKWMQKFQKCQMTLLYSNYNIVRNMAIKIKDFKPGTYPKTEAERLAAAKKYNLLPEEYKVYPDNGMGYGDYPYIDNGLGAEARDPYYPYDYPELKRNYNQPLSVEFDMYGEDRYSVPCKPRYSIKTWWFSFLGFMLINILIYLFLENCKLYPPVAAKQYPADGVVHYTFDMD